ncbi:MAG: hypothetical protein DDT34_00911 [Firmicutes bacterium]|nr:hypothetical protein [Bacillota bacterium]
MVLFQARKMLIAVCFVVLLVLPGVAPPVASASTQEIVYVIPLQGTVDASMERYLTRAFAVAKSSGAMAIILEIDTPGGLLSSAFAISDLIWASPVPIYSYVRFNALSAGAFLALSSRALYMAPGSVIGAAEPRRMDGQAADEKVLSAWEARMRAVAERQGKDPELAAAMVRMSVEIAGLDTPSTLLTLTYSQAQERELADGIFDSVEALLAELDMADAAVRTVPLAPAEMLARFLTHSIVATLFLTIGIAALAIAVSTGDFATGSLGLLAFAMFFGGHIFAGLAGREVIVLFAAGITLLIIEAFVPSFGIIGLTGTAAVFTAVAWSAATTGQGLRMLAVALVVAFLVVIIALKFLKRTPIWSQIVLKYAETKDRGYVGPSDTSDLVGSTGLTVTALRPAGIADINGKRVDVVSDGSFIPQSTEVVVVKTEGSRIVVRPKQ